MSLLDGLLGQMDPNLDIAGIASKFGIDPATAGQAVAALGAAHAQTGGDPAQTVDAASAATGMDPNMLNQIVGHLGGVPGLGQLAGIMQAHPEAATMVSQFVAKEGGVGGLMNMAMGFLGKGGTQA